MIQLTVYGTPKPQGSTRAFIPKGWKRAIITADNKQLKPWRQEISAAALAFQKAAAPYYEAPQSIDLRFFFARPKSAKRRREMTVRPDLDKISRSVLDALTGILFRDDAAVVKMSASKAYGEPERVEITLEAIV